MYASPATPSPSTSPTPPHSQPAAASSTGGSKSNGASSHPTPSHQLPGSSGGSAGSGSSRASASHLNTAQRSTGEPFMWVSFRGRWGCTTTLPCLTGSRLLYGIQSRHQMCRHRQQPDAPILGRTVCPQGVLRTMSVVPIPPPSVPPRRRLRHPAASANRSPAQACIPQDQY